MTDDREFVMCDTLTAALAGLRGVVAVVGPRVAHRGELLRMALRSPHISPVL
jgi:hypothetical protein